MVTYASDSTVVAVVEPWICCGAYITGNPNSDDRDCNTYCEACDMYGSLRFVTSNVDGGWATTTSPRNPTYWRCLVHDRSEGVLNG